ncbi:hypothetical protein Mapa_005963 [Marchantia paleacea]|nr:hypothetical protein Mapa_005963 [Marchantia paleacea]
MNRNSFSNFCIKMEHSQIQLASSRADFCSFPASSYSQQLPTKHNHNSPFRIRVLFESGSIRSVPVEKHPRCALFRNLRLQTHDSHCAVCNPPGRKHYTALLVILIPAPLLFETARTIRLIFLQSLSTHVHVQG